MPRPATNLHHHAAWEVYFGAVSETFSSVDRRRHTGDWTSIGVVQDDPTLETTDIGKAVIRPAT